MSRTNDSISRSIIRSHLLHIMVMIAAVCVSVCLSAEIASAAQTWGEVQAALNSSSDPVVTVLGSVNGSTAGIRAAGSDGPLVVKKGKNAMIRLNGPINRNLLLPRDNGYVMRIEGECRIVGIDDNNMLRGLITGGNNTGNGGGIYIASGGVLRLSAPVLVNKAARGGGIYVESGGTLIIETYIAYNEYFNGGDIHNNIASKDGGGIYVENGGHVYQNAGNVYDNKCTYKYGLGYGVYNKGIYEMNGGEIRDHESQCNAAGIAVAEGGDLYMRGGSIQDNTTGRIEGDGAGVYIDRFGYMEMSGGNIGSNRSNGCGAGIYAAPGASVVLKGGKIRNNKCSTIVSESGGYVLEMGSAFGAGIFAEDDNVYVSGSPVISDNTTERKKNNETYADNLFIGHGVVNINGTIGESARINVRTFEEPEGAVVTCGLPRYASPGQIKSDYSGYTAVSSNKEGSEAEAEFTKSEGLTTHRVRFFHRLGADAAPEQAVRDGEKAFNIQPEIGYDTVWYNGLTEEEFDFDTPITSETELYDKVKTPKDGYPVSYVTGIDGLEFQPRSVKWTDDIYPAEHGQEEAIFAEHGKVFSGWYIDEDFKTKYEGEDFGTVQSMSPDNSAVLYAKTAHEHDGVDFRPWTDPNTLPDQPGNYYLETDVTLTSYEEAWCPPEGEIRLCLNGHTVAREAKTGDESSMDASVIQVPYDSVMYLYDESDKEGKITGGFTDYNGGGIQVFGTLKMYGGTITGNYGKDGGGLSVLAYGNLELYGGTIKGNTCDDRGHGAGVYVEDLNYYSVLHIDQKISIGSGGVSPLIISGNTAAGKESDLSLPGGTVERYINISGKLDPKSSVGIDLRTSPAKKGERIRFTNGFGTNDNIFFATGISANGLPYDIEEVQASGSSELYLRYGEGGSDGIKKNPMTVKAKKKVITIKYSKLKNKNQYLKKKSYLTIKNSKGTVKYKKGSGNKKILVNKKTGKITIKKGLKKGTYKVKVKVKAAGNATYNASAWKTVTFKIKVTAK